MKIEYLRIERDDYGENIEIELEENVSVKLNHAYVSMLANEIVHQFLNETDGMKFLSISMREYDNALVYRAAFPGDTSLAQVFATMQDIANEVDRHIRFAKAILEMVKMNKENDYNDQ